uniref:Uncharacterized protein n=1 Tax=Globodera rostochiensis TaxID=31243 RepID=A0A914HZJ0_GLORO
MNESAFALFVQLQRRPPPLFAAADIPSPLFIFRTCDHRTDLRQMRHSIVFWHSLFLVSLILFISLITFFRRSQWRLKGRPNNSSLASQPIDEEFKEGRDQFDHRMIYSFKGVRLELAWEVHWDGEALVISK